MDNLIVLHAQIQGASACLWVNGVVAGCIESGSLWSQSIHQYLVRGVNLIRLQRIETGDFLPKEDVLIHLNIQLLSPDKCQTLQRWNMHHPGMKWIKAGSLLQVEADLPVNFPRWKFLDVQQMRAETSDVLCIQYFLPELLTSLLKPDYETLHSLFSIRNQEMCSAYGIDLVDFSDAFKERVLKVSSAMQASILDIHPEDCMCVPIGSSPLYYLSDKSHRPFLNWTDSSGEWSLPLHLAVVQRQVYVLR